MFFVPGLIVLATPITQCNIDHVVYTVVSDEHGAILNIFVADDNKTSFLGVCPHKRIFEWAYLAGLWLLKK